MNPKHTIFTHMRKQNFTIVAAILTIFIIFLSYRLYTASSSNKIKQYLRFGGWAYVFHEEISLHKTLPQVFKTITLKGSSLYLRLSNDYTYSFNRQNGSINWKHEANDFSVYNPVFDNTVAYLINFDGRLYAIDIKTGHEIWRFVTPDLYKVDTDPFIAGETVLFGSRNGALYAINKLSGKLVWQYQTKPIDRTTYSLQDVILHFGRFAADDKRVYINSSTENSIISLDLKTGKKLWSFPEYGFVFNQPRIYPATISITNNLGIYYLLDKSTGNILYKTQSDKSKVFEGNTHLYIVDPDKSISAVNTYTGTEIWKYPANNTIPQMVKELDNSKLAMSSVTNTKTTVTLMHTADGKAFWTKFIEIGQLQSMYQDQKNIYLLGKDKQCSLNFDGFINWCVNYNNNIVSSYITHNGLYVVSQNEKQANIAYIDLKTGTEKWTYHSSNINIDTIAQSGSDLYFITKNNYGLVMLNHTFPRSILTDKDIYKVRNVEDNPSFSEKIINAIRYVVGMGIKIIKNDTVAISVSKPITSTALHTIFELTIHSDESKYINKYNSSGISSVFNDPKGKKYRVMAYYFDHNTWKVRFSPQTIGGWKWQIYNQNKLTKFHGNLTVTSSDIPGYITISKTDPLLFIDSMETVFTPVGIQNCVADYNQDGDPLDQWPDNKDFKPTTESNRDSQTMDSYLSTFGKGKFNLFRWGSGNCSFELWRRLSSSGNRYGVNQGISLDKLFSTLKSNNFHIWMSLFSFKIPLQKGLSIAQKEQILKKYLGYIVARYAAYVDIWELANEIKLDDETINFMSSYIRSIDPYHHPITTSWERGEMSTIDITSFHWYSPECNLFCDENMDKDTDKSLKIAKPFVFSESGNNYASWDEYSAARMRIRLWLGFFKKKYFIFWNMPNRLFINKNGPSNIYLGPVERTYVSIFSNFTHGNYDKLDAFAASIQPAGNKIYAFDTGKEIIGYIYRQAVDTSKTTTEITITVQNSSEIHWIDPATGNIISTQSITSGKHSISTPAFSSDLAFIIIYNTETKY